MCLLCRIAGHNVFADTGVEHDVNADDDDADDGDELIVLPGTIVWHVWRRSDGFVGVSNRPPTNIFDESFTYFPLAVAVNADEADAVRMMALACN